MDRKQLDNLIQIASSALRPSGIECIEAEWVSQTRILRIFIDRVSPDEKESGINLDNCVVATKTLNGTPELDAAVSGAYTLEVSSPGVERPLRQKSHFRGHVGAKIEVKLRKPFGDRKHAVGELMAVEDQDDSTESMITLNTNRGEWSFPLGQLQQAHIVFDWNRV